MLWRKLRPAFFVAEKRIKKNSAQSGDMEDIEIGILATAKKMRLSFEELNLFSLDDYLTFVDKWTAENDSQKSEVRQATQADIDRYMG